MVDFYLTHKAYMFHVAKKFSESQSEREDAIQDAMVRLLRNADSLRQLSANQVDMYLFLTIRSVFADRERKAQERMQPMPDATLEILHAEQEAGLEDDGLNAMWDTAILKEHLPAKEWRLLELKYIAGYSDQEIAKETGASSATISRVNRALIYGADGYRRVLDALEDVSAKE